MLEILGILLVVQGVGGLVNRVLGADSPSWFLVLHVLPSGAHIAASVVLALAGGAILGLRHVRGRRSER